MSSGGGASDEEKILDSISGWYDSRYLVHLPQQKYPVHRELRCANKLVFPSCMVTLKTAKMANRILARMTTPEPPGDVERRSIRIPSEDGDPVRVTLYRPADIKGDAPCLVYFHGGGFCMGDADYIHQYAIQCAKGDECVVAFIHYRTSDTVPFPAPFQDCYIALSWAWDNASELRVDRSRIAVGCDSAGGTLAAACVLWAQDEGKVHPCFQFLVYPVTDSRMETDSMKKFTDSPLWNARLNRRMWELYLRDGD